LASSLKLAARCPVSGCWPSCLISQDDGRRHLGFYKFQTFNSRTTEEGRTALPCQIWSKSVKTWPRLCDFSIFQDGSRRHLGFLKFRKDIGIKESNGNVRILTGSS